MGKLSELRKSVRIFLHRVEAFERAKDARKAADCNGKTSAELEAEEARALEEVKRYRKICNDLGDKLWLLKHPVFCCLVIVAAWDDAFDRNPADLVKAHGD